MTNDDYAQAVTGRLRGLSAADRRRVLSALSAQLEELTAAGVDPATALGDPADYAAQLVDALADDAPPEQARWRFLGVPVETRGPTDAEVRSRTWDPADPRLIVPRLLGIGWRLNLGAVAVRLGLIRPDDIDDDVLARIPGRALRTARAVPLVIAGATAAATALGWRKLPPRVASGFRADGRARGRSSRWTLFGPVALGAVPALWAARPVTTRDDALVRAANATSLATVSAGVVAATVLEARRPGSRWGLIVPAALPFAAVASLAVVAVPLRAGLRRAWRADGDVAPAESASKTSSQHQWSPGAADHLETTSQDARRPEGPR